ncbi:MAG: VOC family protein [Nocardioidaceae bacterium]
MSYLLQVTFDCADVHAQAAFWAATLGYVEQPPPEGFRSWDEVEREAGVSAERRLRRTAIVDPDGNGPRLFFQQVPEGKTAKNRVHLDVHVGLGHAGAARQRTLEAEAARLTGLGARILWRLAPEPGVEACIAMADPEGNEFCVD